MYSTFTEERFVYSLEINIEVLFISVKFSNFSLTGNGHKIDVVFRIHYGTFENQSCCHKNCLGTFLCINIFYIFVNLVRK